VKIKVINEFGMEREVEPYNCRTICKEINSWFTSIETH
jgi:hypothetical protein